MHAQPAWCVAGGSAHASRVAAARGALSSPKLAFARATPRCTSRTRAAAGVLTHACPQHGGLAGHGSCSRRRARERRCERGAAGLCAGGVSAAGVHLSTLWPRALRDARGAAQAHVAVCGVAEAAAASLTACRARRGALRARSCDRRVGRSYAARDTRRRVRLLPPRSSRTTTTRPRRARRAAPLAPAMPRGRGVRQVRAAGTITRPPHVPGRRRRRWGHVLRTDLLAPSAPCCRAGAGPTTVSRGRAGADNPPARGARVVRLRLPARALVLVAVRAALLLLLLVAPRGAAAQTNLALGKTATASTNSWPASNGPDQSNNGEVLTCVSSTGVGFTITDSEASAWWMVDLGATYTVSTVAVYGRNDGVAGNIAQSANLQLRVGDSGASGGAANAVCGTDGFAAAAEGTSAHRRARGAAKWMARGACVCACRARAVLRRHATAQPRPAAARARAQRSHAACLAATCPLCANRRTTSASARCRCSAHRLHRRLRCRPAPARPLHRPTRARRRRCLRPGQARRHRCHRPGPARRRHRRCLLALACTFPLAAT
jgi:hypothetical protein